MSRHHEGSPRWPREWEEGSDLEGTKVDAGGPPPPLPPPERREEPRQSANRLTPVNDWELHAAACRKANERNPDEPEPGVKRTTWTWPESWGAPTDRWRWVTEWGTPCETLVFRNRNRVKRLTVPIHGYD